MENGLATTYLGLKTARSSPTLDVQLLLMCSIGPPTQGHVYQMLLQAERAVKLEGKSVVGNVQIVNIALDIECQQYVDFQVL